MEKKKRKRKLKLIEKLVLRHFSCGTHLIFAMGKRIRGGGGNQTLISIYSPDFSIHSIHKWRRQKRKWQHLLRRVDIE